jgi:hypothetical protein
MIDEMMLVFDSPGRVSKVFITALLSRDQTMRERQTRATNNGECAARVFDAL